MATLFEGFLPQRDRNRPGDTSRVLIGEDYFDLANVVGMLLRRFGFDVRLAHDGPAVLAMARKFRPHFILLDIKMPGIGGYELARTLREDERLKGSVIIGISASRPIAPSRHRACR
jgi:CheY-like chemotaxis protein